MMKENYEAIVMTVTVFDENDVIVTSEVDRNNAYQNLSDLNDEDGRTPVQMPPSF